MKNLMQGTPEIVKEYLLIMLQEFSEVKSIIMKTANINN